MATAKESNPTAAPLTRERLDELRCSCGKPDCGEIFLHSNCHREAGTVSVYDQKTGIISIRCVVCQKLVVRILVAKALVT